MIGELVSMVEGLRASSSMELTTQLNKAEATDLFNEMYKQNKIEDAEILNSMLFCLDELAPGDTVLITRYVAVFQHWCNDGSPSETIHKKLASPSESEVKTNYKLVITLN